ncbi:MAG: glycosyltransferase family 4 protein, partial [Limnobacter sp.]|nr:glycosyltransferase family 4 protein [Limnobacter sp.]
EAWADHHAANDRAPGLAVVLSGTDLYCDLPNDPQALKSLKLASHLVVLQELGIQALPQAFRPKAQIIHQCCDVQVPDGPKPVRENFQVIQVGHMREVKDPFTFMQAARLLNMESQVQWLHLGRCLDEQYLPLIRETQAINPGYTWVDSVAHDAAVGLIAQSDLLVHSSIAEGSPHVVIEAMALGTPVLASRVDGNVGTLGIDYEGYFPVQDVHALAAKVKALYAEWQSQPPGGLLSRLTDQVKNRALLFTQQEESRRIRGLLTQLLQ